MMVLFPKKPTFLVLRAAFVPIAFLLSFFILFSVQFFYFISTEINMRFSNDMDDEYEKLFRRLNPPRVVIDNEACKNATVIRVDSANKHGKLLEVVQVLTDLNLIITKAYISSDGGWFMDVFNVTDQDGKKVIDEAILDIITKSLGTESCFTSSIRSFWG
ncbi:ACT DOMAIN-CONTAINING PROTEIN ACR4-RELATED [Salix koriyanagi]|uniref:ACT domain-containing protein ACR n=1 Tax=Salix koriyanagi TaxID=2511006 RepID=A0A9Q0WMB3_9ROSI|nr:ACT DOMAIN-CONTAINING PROTEIN ACR4-RELATED [Salix koriyanagi]